MSPIHAASNLVAEEKEEGISCDACLGNSERGMSIHVLLPKGVSGDA